MVDTHVRELISPDQIKSKLTELAARITDDYRGQKILLIGVLNGGFIVLADLARELWVAGLHDIDIDFVKVSSYGCGTSSNHHPKIDLDLNTDIAGRHVIIVEDIADTGHTLKLLSEYILANRPASLKIFALLDKPSRREVEIKLDYTGFVVNGWIEGYGLDGLRACPSVTIRE